MEKPFPSISIIGMAGSGKTEIGRRLASILDFNFFDTDHIIEKHFNKSLQSILEEVGYIELRQIEQSTIEDMQLRNCVVATGGSAIYGDKGMQYLKNKTVMIFLDVTFETIKDRAINFSDRGFAKDPNLSVADEFENRLKLYNKYADIKVDNNSSINQCIEEIIRLVG
tara:strand:- start:276 stop:779 length:504 start_codon:yes stop_codon:yes gene_type:complete